MSLPKQFISASILLCERVLVERDDVMSIIRVADAFYFQRDIKAPSQEYPAVVVSVFFIARFTPDAPSTCQIGLRLTRPDGESKVIREAEVEVSLQSRLPNTPIGFNLAIPLPIAARQDGIHYITGLINGVEVARAGFSLLELSKSLER